MGKTSVVVWLVAVCVCVAPIHAQRASAGVGSLVRFTTDSVGQPRRMTGHLVQVTRDSIAVERDIWVPGQRIDLRDSLRIALSGVHDLEARMSRQRHTLLGL